MRYNKRQKAHLSNGTFKRTKAKNVQLPICNFQNLTKFEKKNVINFKAFAQKNVCILTYSLCLPIWTLPLGFFLVLGLMYHLFCLSPTLINSLRSWARAHTSMPLPLLTNWRTRSFSFFSLKCAINNDKIHLLKNVEARRKEEKSVVIEIEERTNFI